MFVGHGDKCLKDKRKCIVCRASGKVFVMSSVCSRRIAGNINSPLMLLRKHKSLKRLQIVIINTGPLAEVINAH